VHPSACAGSHSLSPHSCSCVGAGVRSLHHHALVLVVPVLVESCVCWRSRSHPHPLARLVLAGIRSPRPVLVHRSASRCTGACDPRPHRACAPGLLHVLALALQQVFVVPIPVPVALVVHVLVRVPENPPGQGDDNDAMAPSSSFICVSEAAVGHRLQCSPVRASSVTIGRGWGTHRVRASTTMRWCSRRRWSACQRLLLVIVHGACLCVRRQRLPLGGGGELTGSGRRRRSSVHQRLLLVIVSGTRLCVRRQRLPLGGGGELTG
jgi:hypothetical protein